MADNGKNNSVHKLQRWRAGEPLDHRKLNQPVDALIRNLPGVALPRQVMPSPRVLTGIGVRMLLYKSNETDHYVCRTWNGTAQGDTDVLIAKSYLLRASITDDGGSITYAYTTNTERVATLGDDTETQVIVPKYVVDDLLFAVGPVQGGTEVTVSGTALLWVDMNVDGRAWAMKDE